MNGEISKSWKEKHITRVRKTDVILKKGSCLRIVRYKSVILTHIKIFVFCKESRKREFRRFSYLLIVCKVSLSVYRQGARISFCWEMFAQCNVQILSGVVSASSTAALGSVSAETIKIGAVSTQVPFKSQLFELFPEKDTGYKYLKKNFALIKLWIISFVNL